MRSGPTRPATPTRPAVTRRSTSTTATKTLPAIQSALYYNTTGLLQHRQRSARAVPEHDGFLQHGQRFPIAFLQPYWHTTTPPTVSMPSGRTRPVKETPPAVTWLSTPTTATTTPPAVPMRSIRTRRATTTLPAAPMRSTRTQRATTTLPAVTGALSSNTTGSDNIALGYYRRHATLPPEATTLTSETKETQGRVTPSASARRGHRPRPTWPGSGTEPLKAA